MDSFSITMILMMYSPFGYCILPPLGAIHGVNARSYCHVLTSRTLAGDEVRAVRWRPCDIGIDCGIAFDLCKWFGLCRTVGAGPYNG